MSLTLRHKSVYFCTVTGHVSPQKRLYGGVAFVKSIPRTPTGKILRRELKTMLKSKL
jgi:acyl-coenzyme A synthetase/AMP-(fatty) acid ligase